MGPALLQSVSLSSERWNLSRASQRLCFNPKRTSRGNVCVKHTCRDSSLQPFCRRFRFPAGREPVGWRSAVSFAPLWTHSSPSSYSPPMIMHHFSFLINIILNLTAQLCMRHTSGLVTNMQRLQVAGFCSKDRSGVARVRCVLLKALPLSKLFWEVLFMFCSTS